MSLVLEPVDLGLVLHGSGQLVGHHAGGEQAEENGLHEEEEDAHVEVDVGAGGVRGAGGAPAGSHSTGEQDETVPAHDIDPEEEHDEELVVADAHTVIHPLHTNAMLYF